MATLTSCGECKLDVIHRSRRGVVVLEVARSTGRCGDAVVVVDVAVETSAGRIGMCIRKLEARGGVIELPVGPEHRVVAAFARVWETQLNVIHRSCRGVVVLQMA